MRKSTTAVIIVAILLLIGVAIAVTNKSDDQNKSTNQTQTPVNSNSQSTVSQSSESMTGKIEITKNRIFTPSQITVAKGGTVTWTNNDQVAHTVTEDNGEGPDSGSIEPGATYSYTYKNAGSYQYHCKFHPEMRGTIVVK